MKCYGHSLIYIGSTGTKYTVTHNTTVSHAKIDLQFLNMSLTYPRLFKELRHLQEKSEKYKRFGQNRINILYDVITLLPHARPSELADRRAQHDLLVVYILADVSIVLCS